MHKSQKSATMYFEKIVQTEWPAPKGHAPCRVKNFFSKKCGFWPLKACKHATTHTIFPILED